MSSSATNTATGSDQGTSASDPPEPDQSGRRIALAAGWIAVPVIFVVPLLTGQWPGFAVLGIALAVAMVDETITMPKRTRIILRVMYTVIGLGALVLAIST